MSKYGKEHLQCPSCVTLILLALSRLYKLVCEQYHTKSVLLASIKLYADSTTHCIVHSNNSNNFAITTSYILPFCYLWYIVCI